jgi:amino acid adenylation domain-containing protein
VLLEGTLRLPVLEAAFDRLIARHEMLRTNFNCAHGSSLPMQLVECESSSSHRIEVVDAQAASCVDTACAQFFRCEDASPSDFGGSPLLRTALLKLAPERHVLLVSLPALYADTRSLKNLTQDLVSCYAACSDESVAATAEEPVQYVQFSEWQHELLRDEEAEAGRTYWRQQNIGALHALSLPYQLQPAEAKSFVPASHSVALEGELCRKIERAVEKQGVSSESFLLACWQTLLWRLTGQPTIVTGVACDGREYEELHDCIGVFAKFLPLRCRFEDRFPFKGILAQIQESLLESQDWQAEYGWEELEETTTHPTPDGFKTAAPVPHLPFSFEFCDWPAPARSPHLSFSLLQLGSLIDRFTLKLSCFALPETLSLRLDYDAARLSDTSVALLAQQLLRLIASALTTPEQTVGALDIVSDYERRLLSEWNDTDADEADYDYQQCLHQLFETQVAATPHARAVSYEETHLTYAELNARANQLAHYLRSLSVTPDTLVGICLERSIEMVVALLAVLKAGGAYLPLDPQYPQERLAYMVGDAACRVLITEESLRARLPNSDAHVLCLEQEQVEIERESTENLSHEVTGVTPAHLAYVIYTSGSTGRPKGVAVEHRQLLNYLNSIVERLNFAPGSNFATVSTLAADLGNTMIYPSLCTGGTLNVIAQNLISDPDAFAGYVSRHEIDYLKIVPSHLEALLTARSPAQVLPRKALILGGEASHWDLLERVNRLAPECRVFNHYGPTETTIGVLTFPADINQSAQSALTLPLGRPIANTQIYILDPQLRRVPVGVAGELYIGGQGLVRGYFNAPDLTAERFIPHAFGDKPGARLYRTGDIARHLPDGNIEYLGRVDNQVKLRGLRIELGEIETVLRNHPAVREAILLLRQDAPGDKRLVAYIVLQQEQLADVAELREWLGARLPEYMIPSALVLLHTLPLTLNGKIDRRALPAPEDVSAFQEKTFVAPRNAVEQIIANIWAEVLGLEQVSVDSNFFEVGGHSLKAIQIISRIREALRVELSAKSLFDARTVETLSKIVIANEVEPGQSEKIAGVLMKINAMSPEEKASILKAKQESTRGTR